MEIRFRRNSGTVPGDSSRRRISTGLRRSSRIFDRATAGDLMARLRFEASADRGERFAGREAAE